ncbi:hypothetical protein AMK32_25505 [Streptomyces sp. CB01883]|nr:hypothetical protein AMK32_25505 [Streptomyces sp. CB01883]
MRGCGQVCVAVEQSDVDASLQQEPHGGFGLSLGDVQPQVPVGALQNLSEGGGYRCERAGETGEVNGPGRFSGAGAESASGMFESGEHVLGVADQLVAGGGEVDGAASAFQQAGFGLLLQQP